MRILGMALILVAVGSCAAAQSVLRENLRVNDRAELLDQAAEARLTEKLDGVYRDIGTDMTVLTLGTRKDYDNSRNIETFATAIFNQWALGSQGNNSGILILVLRDDREMRIELGAEYGSGYDEIAEDLIKEAFLPAFRRDEYQSGIEIGVERAISHIAEPHARGETVTSDRLSGTAIGLLFVGGLSGAGLLGAVIARVRRKCPKCGEQGLVRRREILQSATRTRSGQGQRHADCSKCGYSQSTYYAIPMISSDSSSSSSGGHSSGGGASGSW